MPIELRSHLETEMRQPHILNASVYCRVPYKVGSGSGRQRSGSIRSCPLHRPKGHWGNFIANLGYGGTLENRKYLPKSR